MEREPNNENPIPRNGFKIAFENGKELYCHKENTMVFLHEQEPYGDHLFIFKTNDDNEVESGDYVFREQIENFTDVVEKMTQRGYNIIPSEDGLLREHDREAYEEYLFTRKPKELPQNDLTKRQHNFANYFGYLLLHNHLTPEEFRNVQGDLHI